MLWRSKYKGKEFFNIECVYRIITFVDHVLRYLRKGHRIVEMNVLVIKHLGGIFYKYQAMDKHCSFALTFRWSLWRRWGAHNSIEDETTTRRPGMVLVFNSPLKESLHSWNLIPGRDEHEISSSRKIVHRIHTWWTYLMALKGIGRNPFYCLKAILQRVKITS